MRHRREAISFRTWIGYLESGPISSFRFDNEASSQLAQKLNSFIEMYNSKNILQNRFFL